MRKVDGAEVDEAEVVTKPRVGEPEPFAIVSVRDLVKQFRRSDGTTVDAVNSTSLDVAEGELVVLLGPSGCGKTTLLRCVAGLERPDAGEIRLRDRVVYSSSAAVEVRPDRRGLAMIFQSYALWPHMTARRNVAYPLQSVRPRLGRSEIAERVHEVLDLVGIGHLAEQYPNQMSGGQQQRVALARALVASRDLILFDEPLSNVDAKVREQLRLDMLAMQQRLGFAALYVTHDQAEAMQLANRVAGISNGRILQLDRPKTVYEHPASLYVADFVGVINSVDGIVDAVDADGVVTVTTSLGDLLGRPGGAEVLRSGDSVVATWRPERCHVRPAETVSGACDEPVNTVAGAVTAVLFVGAYTEHVITVGSQQLRHWTSAPIAMGIDDSVAMSIQRSDLRIYRRTKDSDHRSRRS